MDSSFDKSAILKSKVPLIFRQILGDWKLFHWTFADWVDYFDDQKLTFCVGSKKCSKEPQWERTYGTSNLTLQEFEDLAENDSTNSWLYFNYKHMDSCCTHDPSLLDDINWSCVGFPERTGKDSTLWIGSKGAHTPCHIDTYGCNFIAQLYGKKSWLLFPPNSFHLKPRRVPYEESSIYSSINFQCSCSYDETLLGSAYYVQLEPGDILFVPSHWWHYVENISTAISVNTWIPLASDDLSRVTECLTRFFLASIKTYLSPEQCKEILNPNEDDLEDAETCVKKLAICVEQLKKNPIHKNTEVPEVESSPLSKRLKHFNFSTVNKITAEQLEYLKNKCSCSRNHIATDNSESIEKDVTLSKVINSFCNPQCIELIKMTLLNECL